MVNALYSTLASHAETDRTFLQLQDGRTLSYKQFFNRVSQMGNVLIEQGVKPGDRVAMQVGKSHEALALYVACVKTGAVFLPLNTAYTATEVSYFLNDAEPAVLVCDPDNADDYVEFKSLVVKTLNSEGVGSLSVAADNAKTDSVVCSRELEDLGAILYTSGTTGLSKGAMLTQNNLSSNTEVLVEYWRFTAADVLLHTLPIYHTHGLFVACNIMMASGGSMIFLPSFRVDDVIEQLPRATSMMGVPTFYTRLLKDERFTKELAAHMRVFTSGSAPMLLETHIEFENRTGQRILERYGMTETGMSTSNPYDQERRVGSVGFPLPGVELRICNPETAEEVAQGEIGIIEVRGPNVFGGYWRKPEKTAEEIREDGFFITGDMAMLDSDGYVTIVGRSKDLIISGGFNVYPKEVELAIDECVGVLESAVIGLQHPDFGEAVTAVIVRDQNAEREVQEDDIASLLASDLAKFKQPKTILFVDELPRNTMGKVQKNVLRDQFKELYSS